MYEIVVHVLIPNAKSKCSDEPVHQRSLVRVVVP